MLLFSRVVTAASLWVHILAINLYAARSAYLQGTKALLLGLAAWLHVQRVLRVFLAYCTGCGGQRRCNSLACGQM